MQSGRRGRRRFEIRAARLWRAPYVKILILELRLFTVPFLILLPIRDWTPRGSQRLAVGAPECRARLKALFAAGNRCSAVPTGCLPARPRPKVVRPNRPAGGAAKTPISERVGESVLSVSPEVFLCGLDHAPDLRIGKGRDGLRRAMNPRHSNVSRPTWKSVTHAWSRGSAVEVGTMHTSFHAGIRPAPKRWPVDG